MNGLQISRIQDAFIREKCDADFKTKMKKEMLKATQYIHKLGLWDEWCEYVKENNK